MNHEIMMWEKIRERRDSLLKRSDWTVLPDSNPSPSKEAWIAYRQALRDLPKNFSDPRRIEWPETPRN